MRDLVELRLDRIVDFGNRVSATDGCDATEEIEILPSLAVENILPLT